MAEGSSSRRTGKGTTSSSSAAQVGTSWPFKTALTFDERAKYCLLIFRASKEFEKHIVGVMSKENRKLLDEGYVIAISFHDVEKGKTYNMRMGRMHSSSFEESSKPKPKPKPSSSSGGKVKKQVSTEFVYTIGPERGFNPVIQDKLLYLNKFKEIGLRWSASNKDTLEFQVWYHEMVDLRTLF